MDTVTAAEEAQTAIQKAAQSSAPASTPIQLTEEQSLAVDAIIDFLQDPDPTELFFALSGFAGTGKTFCMREVVARCAKSNSKFVFTAPTNKAAKVLRQIVGEACTIYALLGLRIDKSGEVKTLTHGKMPPDLSDIDAIFIDEGSMVNSNLYNILLDRCQKYDVRVIFMGYVAQLPPVGEASSRIWTEVEQGATLSRVMRHDNAILTLATEIRVAMMHVSPSITIASTHSDHDGVWKLTKKDFNSNIYNAAAAGAFADGSQAKVIAWRNVRVAEYNQLIRSAIYGAEAAPGYYLVGERIVATEPCLRYDETLLTTDDEALVEGVIPCLHPLNSRYKALELKCRTELNKVIRLLVIHPESAELFNNDAEKLAHEAKAAPRLWKKFWDHKELFHSVKYAYALTAHRAQGSTYENVWVDYQDILLNRNRKEAFQCLYVACTRPTTKLFLA